MLKSQYLVDIGEDPAGENAARLANIKKYLMKETTEEDSKMNDSKKTTEEVLKETIEEVIQELNEEREPIMQAIGRSILRAAPDIPVEGSVAHGSPRQGVPHISNPLAYTP